MEVAIQPWAGEIWFRVSSLGRLEARDDLGALVWQAGEGARVHRRLRQRCRGVSGARDEKHLFGRTEALRLSLRSRRRVESCNFGCS